MRTRKLSQRHRTMLLLVDGRRSRTEVIDLAQKAGAAPAHFDDLLAMGMLEEPSVPTVPAPLLEPEADLDVAAHEPAAERVVVEIAPPFIDTPSDGVPQAALPAIAMPVAEPPMNLRAEPLAAAIAEPPPAVPVAEAPVAIPAAEPAPREERRVADRPVAHERRAARAKVAFSQPVEPPLPARRSGPVPLVSLPDAAEEASLPLTPEQRLLAEVRDLLVGALRVDGALSSSLLALRVKRAKTREELIAAVWEIEHSLARSRRPREGRGRLERARDLLGLGNTLVSEDTSFGRDSQW